MPPLTVRLVSFLFFGSKLLLNLTQVAPRGAVVAGGIHDVVCVYRKEGGDLHYLEKMSFNFFRLKGISPT